MIKQLNIKNFQSHKNSELTFDTGINIIVGESDSGKSAILRALNWIINNKPSGDGLRSNWGGDTEGLLFLKDNKEKICRVKTSKVNSYIWGKSTYNSFGQDVPDDIKTILNISPLNIQGQFSSPFLLSVSSGEVAKYLNKIVNLEKIDYSLSKINQIFKKEKTDLKYLEETYRDKKEELNKYDWIDEAEIDLQVLDELYSTKNLQSNSFDLLTDIVGDIEETEQRLNELPDYTEVEKQIEKLWIEKQKINEQSLYIAELKKLYFSITEKETKLKEMDKQIEKLTNQFEQLMPDICPLCDMRKGRVN